MQAVSTLRINAIESTSKIMNQIIQIQNKEGRFVFVKNRAINSL